MALLSFSSSFFEEEEINGAHVDFVFGMLMADPVHKLRMLEEAKSTGAHV